jgi:hypothetical protein
MVLLLLQFTGWYGTRCHIHCDHYWSLVCHHLSPDHSGFIHQSALAITNRYTSYRSRRNWREMSVNFAYKFLFHTVGIFNMPLNFSTWAHGFISPPKEVCYGFLSPLKIHRPQPGLNPRTLDPMANTVTTRPPRATKPSGNSLYHLL